MAKGPARNSNTLGTTYLDYQCAQCGHSGHYHHDSDRIGRICAYGLPSGTCGCPVFDPIDDAKTNTPVCTRCGHARDIHNMSLGSCNFDTCSCNAYASSYPGIPLPQPGRQPISDFIPVFTPRSDDRSNLPQTHIGVRYDLMLPDWLREIAEVLGEGSIKYGDNSWMRIPLDEHLNHVMAHIQQYREGDRSERHLINIVCRMMFSYWTDKHPGEQQAALQQYLETLTILKEQAIADAAYGVDPTSSHDDANTTDEGHGPA